MKKIGAFLIAIACVALVCGGFYYVSSKNKVSVENSAELTEVQKLITRNIAENYPSTPREVVKLYNRIITCYYSQEFKDGELEKLADQTLLLFDDELLAINQKPNYLMSLTNEIAEYKSKSKTISQSVVCSSNDVLYLTDKTDDIAYVNTSYFIKEGKEHLKTYEQFVLRKDENGYWKILGYYQIDGNQEESDF